LLTIEDMCTILNTSRGLLTASFFSTKICTAKVAQIIKLQVPVIYAGYTTFQTEKFNPQEKPIVTGLCKYSILSFYLLYICSLLLHVKNAIGNLENTMSN